MALRVCGGQDLNQIPHLVGWSLMGINVVLRTFSLDTDSWGRSPFCSKLGRFPRIFSYHPGWTSDLLQTTPSCPTSRRQVMEDPSRCSSWIVFKTLPGHCWKKLHLFVVPVHCRASGVPHTQGLGVTASYCQSQQGNQFENLYVLSLLETEPRTCAC